MNKWSSQTRTEPAQNHTASSRGKMSIAFSSASFFRFYSHKHPRPHQSLHYTCPTARLAILGTVPSTFANAILSAGVSPSDISLAKAIEQHAIYGHLIATAPSITTLYQSPSNPAFPDAVFVEDPVVILSPRTAFMPAQGHVSRAGEGAALAEVLKRAGVAVLHVPGVRLDGGDVLKIAGFVLVGMSERTERASVPVLQQAFHDDVQGTEQAPKVLPIPLVGALHLKSLVTWVGDVHHGGEGFLVAPEGDAGTATVQQIQQTTGREWDVALVPEQESFAANVLYIPPDDDAEGEQAVGTVLVQKSCPASVEILRNKLAALEGRVGRATVVPVDTSEFVKANGALTCMSVIL